VGVEFPLTAKAGAIFGGKNVIAVRVDPRANEGWWYEGGGIYRHARLITADAVHFELVGGLYVKSKPTTPVTRHPTDLTIAPRADAALTVQLELSTKPDAADKLSVDLRVLNPQGKEVWAAQQVPLDGKVTSIKGSVADAELWEPPGSSDVFAVLYTLEARLTKGKEQLDDATTTFGIRDVVMSPAQGVLINGKHHKVQGVCNHQDFAGVGTAVPDALQDYRVSRLQQFGVNAWRMSHNPPNEALLDATDRHGFMVWDEVHTDLYC